jgi:hypothetical protein
MLAAGLLLAPTPSLTQTVAPPAIAVEDVRSGCMGAHLRDAIRLNRERLPLYSARSDGRSEGISRRLILLERLALPLAWYVDRQAEPYLRRGIGVVCDDFVSMELVPRPDGGAAESGSASEPMEGREVAALRRQVERGLRAGGWEGAAAALRESLHALEGEPARQCMVRHLLESALRIATLAPRHAAEAERLGMRSPEPVSRLLLRAHLLSMPEAASLDRRAAPVQAEGIPIVCADVPPISAGG